MKTPGRAPTNPRYEQNLERDAKLVAAAQVGGQQGFLKIASEMQLWSTPMHAVLYARELGKQPEAYRLKVGQLAAQMIALAQS